MTEKNFWDNFNITINKVFRLIYGIIFITISIEFLSIMPLPKLHDLSNITVFVITIMVFLIGSNNILSVFNIYIPLLIKIQKYALIAIVISVIGFSLYNYCLNF